MDVTNILVTHADKLVATLPCIDACISDKLALVKGILQ